MLHVLTLHLVLGHHEQVVRGERVLGARGVDAVEHLDGRAEAVFHVVLDDVGAREDARALGGAVAAQASCACASALGTTRVEPAPGPGAERAARRGAAHQGAPVVGRRARGRLRPSRLRLRERRSRALGGAREGAGEVRRARPLTRAHRRQAHGGGVVGRGQVEDILRRVVVVRGGPGLPDRLPRGSRPGHRPDPRDVPARRVAAVAAHPRRLDLDEVRGGHGRFRPRGPRGPLPPLRTPREAGLAGALARTRHSTRSRTKNRTTRIPIRRDSLLPTRRGHTVTPVRK